MSKNTHQVASSKCFPYCGVRKTAIKLNCFDTCHFFKSLGDFSRIFCHNPSCLQPRKNLSAMIDVDNGVGVSTASRARPLSGSPLAITSMRRMSCLWMWSRSKTSNKWVGYWMSMFYGVVVNIGVGVGAVAILAQVLKCLLALQCLPRSHLRNHMERSPTSFQNPWVKMRTTEKPRTQCQQELDSPFHDASAQNRRQQGWL